MSDILLIYPYFKPIFDRSRFRFPPLGICYLAASLQKAGYQVSLLDCTFLNKRVAYRKAREHKADVVGIYCMVTMEDETLHFATLLRQQTNLLIVGGPMPTIEPKRFLDAFDVVIPGESEKTIVDLIQAFEKGNSYLSLPGIVYKDKGEIILKQQLPSSHDKNKLDLIPFPARELLPNESYIRYQKRKYGYAITTIMASRGCPYRCDYCSNVIFGGSYRERTPQFVLDEVEGALRLGYDRISFADDVFTLNKKWVLDFCQQIQSRQMRFLWECLGRVDNLDPETANAMKAAGCYRIFFGIESGNDDTLKLMNKQTTCNEAIKAVNTAHQAGLEVGAFFILFYPGETNEAVLKTLHLASELPLDYVGYSLPYPIMGTELFERIKANVNKSWHQKLHLISPHTMIYNGQVSKAKMFFALLKGQTQFWIKKHTSKSNHRILQLFQMMTDWLLLRLR